MTAKRTSVPAPSTSSTTSTALDTLTAGTTSAPIADVPLDLIDPHPANPRRDLGDLTELADSIRAHGIRQNLLLVPHPDHPDRYRAVIGHRRSAAAALAGLTVVPAAIDDTLDDVAQLELMLLENLQRTDLTAVEEADGYQGLLDLGVKESAIAVRTGRSRSTVRSRLKLVALPDKARKAVHAGQVTLDDALAIASLPADEQETLAKKLGTNGFVYALAAAKARVTLERDAAPLLELLRAANATELPADEYGLPDGLTSTGEVNVRSTTSVLEKADKLREQIAPGWAWRWSHGWLYVYRPRTLEEANEHAARDQERAAQVAEREARAAQEKASRELLLEFARVTADTRREFLEHLVHGRKSLTRDQQTAVLEYAAVAVVENVWGSEYHDGVFREYAVPINVGMADALVRWLRIALPEGHRQTYSRAELLPLLAEATARLSAPQVALAGFASALEPIGVEVWRYGGRSVTTRRWYELLERLGYQVSDEERAALVVPAEDVDDDEDDDADGDE